MALTKKTAVAAAARYAKVTDQRNAAHKAHATRMANRWTHPWTDNPHRFAAAFATAAKAK